LVKVNFNGFGRLQGQTQREVALLRWPFGAFFAAGAFNLLALATKTPFSTNPRWPNTDKKSRKSEKPELLTSTEKVRRSSAK